MLKNKTIWLVPGIVLGALSLTAAEQASMPAPSADRTVAQVNVGRQAILHECGILIKDAQKLLNQQEYRAAIQKYIEAKKKLSRPGDKFVKRAQFCDRMIEECYYRMAEQAIEKADDLATSNDFEAAIKLCREALKYCPERREELTKKIAFYEKRRDAAVFRESTAAEKFVPNASAQEYQIQLTLEKARRLVQKGELMQAKHQFEQILLIDPYNVDATQDLLGVNNKIQKEALLRTTAANRHLTGQVVWAPTIPIVPDAPVGNPENQIAAPVEKKSEQDELIARLQDIVIPDFTIEDKVTTFRAMMDELSACARRFDKSKRGVTFVIKTKPAPSVPAVETNPQAVVDPAMDPAMQPQQQQAVKEVEEPTLAYYSKKEGNIYSILCDLQKRGDLSFKVDQNAVFVAAPGTMLEELTVRRFPLEIPPDMTQQSLEDDLKSSGIPFTVGCYACPIKERSHIIVCNTPENLKKIEGMLLELSNRLPMVQIMFKIIEVNQKDLDELAFNWQYSTNNGNADGRFNIEENSNQLLRHYGFDDSSSSSYEGKATAANTQADATYNIHWRDANNDLKFSVYALDWADNSDVLYSPRVTTLSGVTASIDMSVKHYYPSEWETIDADSNNDFYVYVDGAQPTLDDEQDLGIKFQITPEVTDRFISAEVNIPIKLFYDWLIVDTRTNTGESSGSDNDDGEYTKKPIFSEREIQNKVTLKDGETVLIGSICEDKQDQIHDKVPILGDIPLVGRLFQSKYTNSQKINLLIFMTCKLIKPDGSAQYPEDMVNTGVPTFPRNQ